MKKDDLDVLEGLAASPEPRVRSQLPALLLKHHSAWFELSPSEPRARAALSLASYLAVKWLPRLRAKGFELKLSPREDARSPKAACECLDVDWRDVERHFLSEFP